MIVNTVSCHHQVSAGILGLTLCFFVVIPSGNVIGQEIVSQFQDSEAAAGKASTARPTLKAQRWTVSCEREDGTHGIFRVSSNVPDEASLLDLEPGTNTPDMVERPPSPNLKIENPTEDLEHEDPFGTPTLKCGRLLTLLAIFGSGEFQAP